MHYSCNFLPNIPVFSLDNSEYSRNGDFPPSRLRAQQDAVNIVTGSKTGSHPENHVAIMTSAGEEYVLLLLMQDHAFRDFETHFVTELNVW